MDQQKIKIIQKYRDYQIIKRAIELAAEIQESFKIDHIEQLTERNLSPYESALILAGEDWKLPVIYGIRKETENKVFSDPQTSGEQLSVVLALISEWIPFQKMLMREALLPWQNQENTIALLSRATWTFRLKHGGRQTQEFVERLWKHRWIYDAQTCAELLWAVVDQIPNSSVKMERSNQEEEWAFHKVTELITEAKNKVNTLDEWFEELYLLSPWIKYASLAYERSQHPEANKHLRWLAEAIADIGTVWLRGIEMLREVTPYNPYYWSIEPSTKELQINLFELLNEIASQGEELGFVTEEELRTHRSKNSIKEQLRRLSYGYHARITYPKFWFQTMSEHIAQGTTLPASLGRFTPQRLVSIYITYSPLIGLSNLCGLLDHFSDEAKNKSITQFNTKTHCFE